MVDYVLTLFLLEGVYDTPPILLIAIPLSTISDYISLDFLPLNILIIYLICPLLNEPILLFNRSY